MTEINERPFEERLVEMGDWVGIMGNEGKVIDINPQLVKGVLEDLGAKTEISEEAKKSLGKYSNFGKRPGLDETWGMEKVDTFNRWVIGEFIPSYEKKVGKELHTLWDPKTETFDNIKHSGMMQFLGELTAFAEGVMPIEEYQRLTEDRIGKGVRFEKGDPYEPYKPSKHSSIPPEFPLAALNYLIGHKSE
jgi:hypothetical protein